MLDTTTSSVLLFVMEVVGPLLLLAAIVYGTMAWSKRTWAERQAGERKAKRLFEQRDPM